LAFTENRGQCDARVRFRADVDGVSVWFADDGIYYQFTRSISRDNKLTGPPLAAGMTSFHEQLTTERVATESMVIVATFVGANPQAKIIGKEAMEYKCNYFLGNDPNGWYTDVPNYRTLIYEDIYPGIDLKYCGIGQEISCDFVASVDADPGKIQVDYDNANVLGVNDSGALVLGTAWGKISSRILPQRPIRADSVHFMTGDDLLHQEVPRQFIAPTGLAANSTGVNPLV
ncbi:MAG: hypothetical protein GY869_06860, partial [Planctomycetes bacterium]|nr:hypothetical protein [Planctomycetota bacterium]